MKVPFVSNSKRLKVLARDGRVCRVCHKTEDLTIDHIRPSALGGANEVDNLQVLCRRCNTSKGRGVTPLVPPPVKIMPKQSTDRTTFLSSEARLADRYAMRFVTMFQAGLSQAEIARQLGLTRQRVSQILKRARERGLIEDGAREA